MENIYHLACFPSPGIWKTGTEHRTNLGTVTCPMSKWLVQNALVFKGSTTICSLETQTSSVPRTTNRAHTGLGRRNSQIFKMLFYGPHNIFFLNATKWYLQGLASLQGFEKIQGLSSSLNDRKNEHNNNQNNPKALHGRNNIE